MLYDDLSLPAMSIDRRLHLESCGGRFVALRRNVMLRAPHPEGSPLNGKHRSAFDLGRAAGQIGAEAENPYAVGTADHRNYTLGHGFGTRDAAERRDYATARPEASAPDHDEIDD